MSNIEIFLPNYIWMMPFLCIDYTYCLRSYQGMAWCPARGSSTVPRPVIGDRVAMAKLILSND
jgi:hypothetical protein